MLSILGEDLLILCLDLFLAGSKTTTDTLAMVFSFLPQHPEWLKILQDDLNDVVGRNRAPRLSDRPLLPRVDAFLAEVLITEIIVIRNNNYCPRDQFSRNL